MGGLALVCPKARNLDASRELTDVLRCTEIEHDVSVASAERDNGLGIAGAVDILAIGIGSHAQNLLGWQARSVLSTECATTPAGKGPLLSSSVFAFGAWLDTNGQHNFRSCYGRQSCDGWHGVECGCSRIVEGK